MTITICISLYIFAALLSAFLDRAELLGVLREVRAALVAKRIGVGSVLLGLVILFMILAVWPVRAVIALTRWLLRSRERDRVD